MIKHKDANWSKAILKANEISSESHIIEKILSDAMLKYLEFENKLYDLYFDLPEVDCQILDGPTSRSKIWNFTKQFLVRVRLAKDKHSELESKEIPTLVESTEQALLWAIKFSPAEIKEKFNSEIKTQTTEHKT